jgi:8-oxo-dGTP pyrophosphatase MutT (NUDIX family)
MNPELTRDFTVAVFVVHNQHVLLHPHPKVGLWLPPGGHIDAPELPDEAAVREVREEAGIEVELIGERGVELEGPDMPLQLVRPEGIQLETIAPNHQHIDLIYFATVVEAPPSDLPPVLEPMRWLRESDFPTVPLNEEVTSWARRALAQLS